MLRQSSGELCVAVFRHNSAPPPISVRRLLANCYLLLALFLPSAAMAQITAPGPNGPVCVDASQALGNVAIGDECGDPTFIGFSQISFGPGSTLQVAPGGTAAFNGTTTLNSAPTFTGGITVTGAQTLNMGNNRVQNVADPTADTDAANKRYVDQQNATQQTQIDSNTTRITNTENVNATQQTQISNIQTVNSNQQVQIDQNTATNNTQAIEIAALGSAVGSLSDTTDRLQSQINNLDQRDDELAEGIAIALALDQPFFHAGQTFALNIGWGGYDGANAVGVTAAGIVDRGAFGPTSTTTLHGGIGAGTGQGQVAGKAGLSFGW